MNSSTQLANHFKEVIFGGNWTASNLKDCLADISWKQATRPISSVNTIAQLVFHIHYFIVAVLDVLKGNPLNAHDKYSFDLKPINSQEEWDSLVRRVLADAVELTKLIEELPEEKIWQEFTEKKYGNYYRNLLGIIEHTHYHLGQITIIKKLLSHSNKT